MTAFKDALSTLQAEVTSLVTPLATLAIIVCALFFFFGSDPQTIKKAKNWGICIFIGVLIINHAEDIVAWFSKF